MASWPPPPASVLPRAPLPTKMSASALPVSVVAAPLK
jgi:hypothetical protein